MKLTKRILSLLLTLVLVCTILPMELMVSADEVTEETSPPEITVEPADLIIPEEVPEDATTDAIGTLIPTIGETLPIEPWVNPIYEDLIDVADLPPANHPAKPDATVQATFLDLASAAAQLEEQMKARATSITLNVYHTSSDYNAILDALLALACLHDGDPKGGDYLLYHYFGLGPDSSVDRSRSGSGYNYTYTLNMVYSTTATQEATLDSNVAYVLRTLNLTGKSDYEKIKAVYDYMCKYIKYDNAHLSNPDYLLQYSAYAALVNCSAVCQGYATLFYRFMMELGIDCRVVTGIGGTPDNYGPHAWNIVKVDGLYYNLDATWDAGNTSYEWFLTSTWDFPDHYRDYVYDSLEFHTLYPMAAETYVPGVPGEVDPFITYGWCGDEAIWLFSRYGELAITGIGAMYDYGNSTESMPDWTYLYGDYITAVYVDEGITRIGNYSFSGLQGIVKAELPDSLLEIGNSAFYNCQKLKAVTLGKSLVTIEYNAFANCSALTSVELPATLETIGGSAFSNCSALTHADLPENLQSLGSSVFSHCSSLTEMHVPDTVTYMGTGVFAHCTSLTAATLPSQITDIGTEMFYYCTSLETVIIPDGVTAIGSKAFANCFALTTANIPSTVTSIGKSAFYQCYALTGVDLPAGLTVLGESAFYYCKSITHVVIPEGITEIGRDTFTSCVSLETLILHDGITSIEQEAFKYCTSLKSLELPASLTTLKNSAFSFCGITSIYIPATLTSISSSAFAHCNSLTTAVFEEGCTTIPDDMFLLCHNLSDVTLASTITSIGSYAFRGNAFQSIQLPESLTHIYYGAFCACKITQITIPASVVSIRGQAFSSCDDLTTVIFEGDAPELASSIFDYTGAITVYYPGNNETWTEDKFLTENGRVTWVGVVCEHENESVVTAPTCTERGYTTNTCTLCGMVTVTDYVDALGHTSGDIQVENNVAPTCTVAGSYDNVTYCTVCEAELTRETVTVEMLPHTPGEARTENVADPTCSATGSYDLVTNCVDCGAELTRETVTMEMLPHTYESAVTQPTCTEAGYTTYTCAVCGDSYTADPVDALGHSFTYEVTAKPGKYKTGTLTGTCSVCGHTEDVILPVLNEEDYHCVIILEPTEEATGTAVYTWTVTTFGEVTFEVTLRKLNDVILGDVNGDESIDTTDAYYIVMFYNEMMDLTDAQLAAADVNGDGEVDTTDAYYIVMFYNEMIDSFPAEEE